MKMYFQGLLAFALFSLSLSLVQPSTAFAVASVKVDGSSTVFPITEAVAEEFQNLTKGKVRVTVGISGTGGGFKKFCRGEIDVQDASRPILKEEMENCRKAGIKYFEIPVAFDAMTVVVSPKNKWLNSITVAQLKKMWEPAAQNKIKMWNQIEKSWPKKEFKLFGAGSDSGTFDYFTEAIVGKAKSSRGDFTGSEDDNVLVQGIADDENALGYIPFAYYELNKNKLKALSVDGGPKAPSKKPVAPSAAAVEDGTYFPLSRPVFIYVSDKSAQRQEVKDFIKFYLEKGAELAKQVKYVPLPKAAYETALKNFNNNKLGTIFGGHSEVGLKIEELLKREAQH